MWRAAEGSPRFFRCGQVCQLQQSYPRRQRFPVRRPGACARRFLTDHLNKELTDEELTDEELTSPAASPQALHR
jgi:hypothetical protein